MNTNKTNIEELRAEQAKQGNDEIKKISKKRLTYLEENISLLSNLKAEDGVHVYIVDENDNIDEENTATLQQIAALNLQREVLMNKLMAA